MFGLDSFNNNCIGIRDPQCVVCNLWARNAQRFSSQVFGTKRRNGFGKPSRRCDCYYPPALGGKKNLLDNFLIDIHQIRSCIITPLHSLDDMWDKDDHVDLPIVQLVSDRSPASRSYASPIVQSPLAETIHMLLLDIKELLGLTQNK